MKKTLSIILALSLLLGLFVSCNIDATEGIYSQIASSTVSTTVRTCAYLGSISDSHYYLSDDGVYKIGSSDAIAKNSANSLIKAASLKGSELYVLRQEADLSSRIEYYSSLASDPVQVTGFTFSGLLVNGLAYNDKEVYKLTSGSASPILSDSTIQKIHYIRETNEYTFVSAKTASGYKFYVIKDGSLLFSTAGDASIYAVFQPVTDASYILVKKGSTCDVFNLTSAGVDSEKYCSLYSTLPQAYSTQSASFHYSDSTGDYVVVKCSNYFDRIKLGETDASKKVQSISSDFALNLRTADIVNIKSTADPKVFIAATFESMLYKIDMTENKSTQIK